MPETYGRDNYATGSANLEARAAIWAYATAAVNQDWFLDLVEWDGVRVAADVGCGSGRFLGPLNARVPTVIGVDYSMGMLDEIVGRCDALLVNGDVCRLPLRDGCVDAALAAWMLYHADDLDEASRELRRVVAPGGALVAITNGSRHIAELDRIYEDAIARVYGSVARHWTQNNRFTFDEAAHFLSQHFDSVTMHVRRTELRVPDPEPVVAYLASVPSYMDVGAQTRGVTFDDLVPHIRAIAEEQIAERGAVAINGLSAAIVCR